MQLAGMNSIALCIALGVLLMCSAGQTGHGYLRIMQSSAQARTTTVVYECAILFHIMLMAAFVLGCLGDQPDAHVHFIYLGIPTLPALWTNVIVAIIAGYTAVASLAGDDMPGGFDDFSWTPAVDAVIVLLCTPPVISLMGSAWPFVLFVDVSYFLYRTCFLLLDDKRLRNTLVSSLSMVESMKLLPEGLLYADKYGRTLVANDAMRHCLSSMGLSTDFGQVDDLWKLLNEQAEGDRAVSVAESIERERGSWVLLRISDREVRLFSFEGNRFDHKRRYPSARPLDSDSDLMGESKQLLGGEVRMRVLAYDVTREVEILQEIEHTNIQLAASQRELQESLRHVQEAAENEAMLRMRGRVHDVIGQRLSMLHRALEDDDISDEKLDQLKPLLNSILTDLSAGTHAQPADELAATVNAFAVTGVDVHVEGALPSDERMAKLYVDCIREGTTNALKHSNATRVNVVCTDSGLTIENDGLPSTSPIEEGTGLSNMRRAIEAAGGQLTVQADPFALRITLP